MIFASEWHGKSAQGEVRAILALYDPLAILSRDANIVRVYCSSSHNRAKDTIVLTIKLLVSFGPRNTMQFFRRTVAHLGIGRERIANQLERRQEGKLSPVL